MHTKQINKNCLFLKLGMEYLPAELNRRIGRYLSPGDISRLSRTSQTIQNNYEPMFTCIKYAKQGDYVKYLSACRMRDLRVHGDMLIPMLYRANIKNDVDAIRALTEMGANQNKIMAFKNTVLNKYKEEIFFKLNDPGTQLDAEDMKDLKRLFEWWEFPIHLNEFRDTLGKIVYLNKYEVIEYFLSYLNEGRIIATSDAIREMLSRALIHASSYGHLSVVKLLLNNGAVINSNSGNEDSRALEFASREGKLEVVKYLVEHGARIGLLSLTEAVHNDRIPVLMYLIEYLNGLRPMNPMTNMDRRILEALKSAAETGRLSIVQYIVDMGANVNALRAALNMATNGLSRNTTGVNEVIEYLKNKLENY